MRHALYKLCLGAMMVVPLIAGCGSGGGNSGGGEQPSGTIIRQFGGTLDNGMFYVPAAVAVDGAGNIYVADTGNNRVQKFDASGSFLASWGSTGRSSGQFYSPRGLVISPISGTVYVADAGNDRIQEFSSNGTFQSSIGSRGTGTGFFNYPAGVTLDASGNLWVADDGNSRIQKFDPGGNFVSSIGSYGTGTDISTTPTASV